MSEFTRRLQRFVEVKPTLQKLVNYLLNKISKSFMSNYALGLPHQLILEVTNFCNLHCSLCPTGNALLQRGKAKMLFDDFKRIIDKMASYLIEISIAGFGEPFLNEDIYRILEYIHQKGIFIKLYTNFICLDKDGIRRIVDCKVDKLIVSLDAPDANAYSCYKGIDGFNKLMDNLRYLVDIKKQRHCARPLIILQFLMIKDNVAQIHKIRQIAEDTRVDILSMKTPNLYLFGHNNHQNSGLKECLLSKDFNRYRFNSSTILPCPWVWESLIIYANGDIGPCCYDSQGDYVFGNIFSEDIGDIWNNKRYREFRMDTAHKRNKNQLCAVCMERRKGVKIAIVEYPINKLRF